MAHNMLKPYSFLLYLLSIISCFFAGITYASIIDAAKGQMLAGGAIVLGYGVLGSGIGLILALILANKLSKTSIIKTNVLLSLIIVAFYAYYHLKYLEKQQNKQQNQENIERQKTAPKTDRELALFTKTHNISQVSNNGIGLGMFSPNISENKPLYFYANPNLDKSSHDHVPTDSISFKKSEYSGYDIATAPPWLVPNHLKLDYDILYFKVESITPEFYEVTVNTHSQKTTYVKRSDGTFQFWADFFLHVHSVEFLKPNNIYVKPLDHAGKLNTVYSFMKPIRVKPHWMLVNLLNDNFQTIGSGWIKWMENGKLLITYSLLS